MERRDVLKPLLLDGELQMAGLGAFLNLHGLGFTIPAGGQMD